MSALTAQIGEVLVAVTEDRHRVLLHFENGKVVCIEPKAPDSRLESEHYGEPPHVALPVFKHCHAEHEKREPHPCPYAEEINDNHELCTCCGDCQHECAMDI